MRSYRQRAQKQPRRGARAVVVGIAVALFGLLAIQTSSEVRLGLSQSRRLGDELAAGPDRATAAKTATDPRDARIAALEAELRDMQRWKAAAEVMTLRMQAYERLLGLVGEVEGKAVTARVVAEADGPFAASLIANAGAASGVREGYIAINERGLVGRVVRVGRRTSRVLLISDYNSRIPVMGRESQDRALLVGDREGGARLMHPESPDAIREGEVWVTSGDDGRLPFGLNVGRSRRTEKGEWRVELAMSGAAVDHVRLLPPPDFIRPEDDPAPAAPPAEAARPARPAEAPPRPAITPPPAAAAPPPVARPAEPPVDPGTEE